MTTRASTARDDFETKRHRALGDPSRVRLLALLREAGSPLDAHELAKRVGLHPNTVRLHLHVLAEAELVSARREERSRPGRPRTVYELAPDAESAEPRAGYRLLAQILAGALGSSAEEPSTRAEEAGEAWGRFLIERPTPFAAVSAEEAIERVVRQLDEFGFAPALETDETGRVILMRECPFGELARAHQDVVCAVHFGLMRGALAELGGRVEADRIEPLVEPSLCVAHLAERRG